MQRRTIFSVLWLGGAMLSAAASSVVAAEPTSPDELVAGVLQAGRTQDFAAVKSLAKLLSHDSRFVRQSSAWALSQLGEVAAEAGPSLIQALNDSEVRVRWAAAVALGRIGRNAEMAEPALWQAVLDRDANVRCESLAALRTVSVSKHRAALKALNDCLSDPSADVQAEAIATFAAIQSRWDDDEKRPLVSPLVKMLDSSNDDLRLASAVLLGDLGLSAAPAIIALASATDDMNEHVQAAALRAVERFADEVDRCWNQLDAAQRNDLRSSCQTVANILEDRGRDSAEIASLGKQFRRLSDGIQLISAEGPLALPKPLSSPAEAISNDSDGDPTLATPAASNGWRWACVILLAGIGLWGVRQTSVGRTASAAASQNESRTEERYADRAPVPDVPHEPDDLASRREGINIASDAALDATATLNQAMRDEDSVVRLRSTSAVTALHGATVPQLLAAVTSSDPEVRRLAITSLRSLGANALRPFVEALQDGDARVRQAAAVTLGQIGPGAIDAVPQLTVALSDVDPRVRGAAAMALSVFGPHAMEAVPELRAALLDEFPIVRARAAFALGQIGPSARRAAEELIRLVSDPDVSVRRNSVSALGGIGADTDIVLPALRQAATDVDASVRRCALTTLGLIDAASAATISQRALTDVDAEVRQCAQEALASPGCLADSSTTKSDRGATELRVFCPEPTDESIAVYDAEESLEAADFIAQLEGADADIRWKASQGLEQLGTSAVPEMIASLSHRNPAVRRSLIVSLGRVGTEARLAAPAILVALHDVNSDVRCAAADCLGQLGVVSRSIIQALVQALSDPNAEVRRYAATTLGRFGKQAREATAALQIASISDIAAKVRTAAQTALQRISESLVGAA